MKKNFSNKEFYNKISDDYDDMISFSKAIEVKRKFFKEIVNPEIVSAADIGCGSGVDSLALASFGLKVSAFDPSFEMIKLAESNMKKMNLNVEFFTYSADEIPESFDRKFDLAVSLGNTFANISTEKLEYSLNRIYDILKPGGKLMLQVLNYKRILTEQERIVNITEGQEKYFIRFYDFFNDQIFFNILTFLKSNPADRALISTKIYPHEKADLSDRLQKAGFQSVRSYTDFKFTEYFDEKSKDLLIVAEKSKSGQ